MVLTSLISQFGFVKGSQLLPSGYSALIRSIEGFFAYIFQIIIFNNKPGYIKIIGAIIITLSVLIIIRHNLKKQKIKQNVKESIKVLSNSSN